MRVETILIAQIDVPEGRRPAAQVDIDALAADIAVAAGDGIGHDGLRVPIDVQRRDTGYRLISGLHRLCACEVLGRESIAAVVHDVDDETARMMEVAENFFRAELNPLERALIVRDFRDAFEAKHGAITRGGDRKSVDSEHENQSANLALWSDEVCERLALSERARQRYERITRALAPETIARLRPTAWAENQSALLELCGVPVERQSAVLDLLEQYPALSMREAIMGPNAGPAPGDEDEKWFRKSLAIFGQSKARRRRFFREAFVADLDIMRETAREAGFRIEPIKGGPGGADG